jgi:hypothetical protein
MSLGLMGLSIQHNKLRAERNVLRAPFTAQFSAPSRSWDLPCKLPMARGHIMQSGPLDDVPIDEGIATVHPSSILFLSPPIHLKLSLLVK